MKTYFLIFLCSFFLVSCSAEDLKGLNASETNGLLIEQNGSVEKSNGVDEASDESSLNRDIESSVPIYSAADLEKLSLIDAMIEKGASGSDDTSSVNEIVGSGIAVDSSLPWGFDGIGEEIPIDEATDFINITGTAPYLKFTDTTDGENDWFMQSFMNGLVVGKAGTWPFVSFISLTDVAGKLAVAGTESSGTSGTGALHLSSGSQSMYLDGNEIDSSVQLYFNYNNNNDVYVGANTSKSNNVYLIRGSGKLFAGASSPLHASSDDKYIFTDAGMWASKISIAVPMGTPETYELNVYGTIRAREILVDSSWADFVFDDSYQLMPLRDLEDYIFLHNKLPGLPSAADVKENGVSVGETQANLLQKVEELTLYVIEQNRLIAKQGEKIAKLEKAVAK